MCCFVTSIIERPRLFLGLQHAQTRKPIYTLKCEEPLTDSPERDAFIESESNTYDGSHALPTIEGFRVIMATEDEAVVEYLAADGGAEAYIRINLLWSDSADDWRINSEGGQTPVEVGPINDRSAYIPWR